MKRTAFLFLALMFVMPCLALSEEPVQFQDANLRRIVEEQLFITNPKPSDMLSLTGLDGHDCNITDLTGIEYATNLEWLDLSWNNISNISALSGLTNLYDLFLEHNQIVDISVLSQLTNLEFLVLSNNNICDISSISGLKQLWALDLAYNQITDISALSGLVDLEELTLNNNQISDISYISHLYNLYFLDLWSNPLNADALAVHIPRIITNNPGIEIYYDQWIGSGLTVSSAHGGSVIQPGEGSFEYDGVVIVAIEAAADSSYSFVCWTGTAVEAGKVADPYSASTTVLVDGDYTLQANFQRADGSVYFADPNLQVCVEQALGVSNPTPDDMLRLTYLHRKDFPNIVIQDLTGLEYAKNLQELWLWGHQVEDLSPLADLTQLRVLDVGDNSIWNISALYKLINLEELYIDDTEVQDISVLSNFTKLTGLDLSYTWFESLDVLEQLKHLNYLALEGDSIVDISILSNLTNLVQLNLAWNCIEDLSPLQELDNLMVLDLSYNEIIYTDSANYDLDISPLGELTNLKELYLEGCSIWDLSPLSELTSLQILNLSDSVWDDLSPLSQLKQLTYLDLSGCDIEDVNMCDTWGSWPGCYIPGIDFISELDKLEFVNLYFNRIEDISPLMGLTNLKVVDLRANPLSEESCLLVQQLIDRSVIVLCKCGMQAHILVISSTGGGRVTEPGQGSFTDIIPGTTMTIEAAADPGYYFVSWTGTAVDAGKVADPFSTSTTVIVDGNYTLQANFASTNHAPDSPTLLLPVEGSLISSLPAFQLYTTDTDDDRLKFKIEIMRNEVPILNFDQTRDVTNWNNTEYYSGEIAIFTLPESQALNFGIHQWRAYAFDGKCWSTPSEIQSFNVVYQQPTCDRTTLGNTVTIIGTVVEERAEYSILVPSKTDEWWRSTYLFPDVDILGIGGLDSYDIRVQRYRNAFVAAIMQPELTKRLKTSGYIYALLNDMAVGMTDVAKTGSELAKLASVLIKKNDIYDLAPESIRNILLDYLQVLEHKYPHLYQSLDKLSVQLTAIGFVAHIAADVLDDIFLHAIANAMVLEKMECLDKFLSYFTIPDSAITEGYMLARQDINDFVNQDVSVIQSTINSLEDHAVGYFIEGAKFFPKLAQTYSTIGNLCPASIKRIVLPTYLFIAYDIGVELSADIEDMQSICSAATLNAMLYDWMVTLESELPEPSDPSYDDAMRLLLTTAQIRFGLGYWYYAKYDQVLDLNLFTFKPSDWIKSLVQTITGSYSSIAAFREDFLQVWMDNNYNYTVGIYPCLGFQ